MARQAARLIAVLALAAAAFGAAAQPPDRLKTPQTPWSQLSQEERRILRPVEDNWERLPGYQQERLKGAARKYPSMQPIQKERFESRIRDWAAMTPEQRKAAREAFQGLRQLPPEKQHELRERYLQRHRHPSEDSSGQNFSQPQKREFVPLPRDFGQQQRDPQRPFRNPNDRNPR